MINKESQDFMLFVDLVADDPEYFHYILKESIHRAANYLSRNPQEIKQTLLKKLELGAREHGEPIYTQEEVEREQQAEYIDIIGWYLVEIWQNVRNSSND